MTHDDDMPEALRWSLRGLRRDESPARDLWPAIATRLAAAPQLAAAASTPPRPLRMDRRMVAWATAASLLVALGLGWQLRTQPGGNALSDRGAQLIALEASALTLEYKAALLELDAGRPLAGRTALRDLDRSAAQVRTALTRDPEARFLLDRLQSVYARRLALTRRLATLT